MRVGIYARVSTQDKDQDPETQLLPLREFCRAQGWGIAGEYVDHASATDDRRRGAWKRLLAEAATRRVDVILCWKMDRAFRSVARASRTLEDLRRGASASAATASPGSIPPAPIPPASSCSTSSPASRSSSGR